MSENLATVPEGPVHERPAADAAATPLLRVEGVSKAFGGVQALEGAELTLERGTVHAIVGHNGAGKSTLMKILSGVEQPDSGSIFLDGEPMRCRDPRDAQRYGVSMVHQELSVLEDLDVAENIFLERQPRNRLGLLRRSEIERRTRELLDGLGLRLSPRARCSDLGVGERQMVEIARAISWNARVLILDEPTSALTRPEQDALFALIERLRNEGYGILYISHRIDEILHLADTVTVLRDGQNVGVLPRRELNHSALVAMMLGGVIEKGSSERRTYGAPVLEVSGLHSRAGGLYGIDLAVSGGEIVGLAGMLGSGRSELFECLFGCRPFEQGSVRLKGAAYAPRSPIDAMRQGVGLVPEDRKVQGIFPGASLWRNVSLPSLHDLFNAHGFVRAARARAATEAQQRALDIRARSVDQDIIFLSGGNQQKAVLARWVMRNPDLLLLDEPTAGIDIGAKAEIHDLIRGLAERGMGIVVSSSEFDELIGLCHRILVIRDGRIIEEVDGALVTEHELVVTATGGGSA